MQPGDYPLLFPHIADKVARYEEILDQYRSLANCPESWRLDIVSFSLETRHGAWVAQVPVKPRGISKKKRTVGTPEFRLFTEVQGQQGPGGLTAGGSWVRPGARPSRRSAPLRSR